MSVAAALTTAPAMAAARRDPFIDALRGIAILMVVADHSGLPMPPLFDYFMVPCFFIASGILFNPRGSFFSFMGPKLLKYMVPYFVYNTLYILFDGFAYGRGWGGSLFVSANQPLWFFKALLWSLAITRLCWQLGCYATRLRSAVTLGVATVVISVVSNRIMPDMPQMPLFLGLVPGFQAWSLVSLGILVRQCLPPDTAPASRRTGALFIGAGLALGLGCSLAWHGSLHLYLGLIGYPWVYMPYTTLCFFAFWLLVKGFCRPGGFVRPRLWVPLLTVGRLTLPIFCLQEFAIHLLRDLMACPAGWPLFFAASALTVAVSLALHAVPLMRRLYLA